MDAMVEIKLTLSSEVDSFGDMGETLVAEHGDNIQIPVSVYPLLSSKDCFLACNYTKQ